MALNYRVWWHDDMKEERKQSSEKWCEEYEEWCALWGNQIHEMNKVSKAKIKRKNDFKKLFKKRGGE